MARRRRRKYRGLGKLLVKELDSYLPPLVGGGSAMGTTLILRGFMSPLKEDGTENWAYKWSGFIGAGAGVGLSLVLGPFKGWGAAISGALTAALTGCTAQLYNKVTEGGDWSGYGMMVARRAPYGQPAWYGRGKKKLGMGVLKTRVADPSLPENVSIFANKAKTAVNAKAWGGQSF